MSLDSPSASKSDKFRPLQQWYIGQVVDNDDKKGLGRVKVEIPGLTKGIEKEFLPWFSIMLPAGLGGSCYSTTMAVPQVNTMVVCAFPTEDLYSGWIIGTLLNRVTMPDDKMNFAVDYIHPKSSENHFTQNWDKVDDTTPG